MKNTTHIVLLRGVMPTGKNKVPMAQLREVLTASGFVGVRTYIQTGNILLESNSTPQEIEKQVHNLILKKIGPDLFVISKSARQLQNILDANPFKNVDPSRVFYTLLSKKPTKKRVDALMAYDFASEKLAIAGNAAYMYIPGSAARSKLSNNFLEKKLEVSATTRNLNTMKKLIELSRAKS